jgi:hypothetical protein
MASQLLEDAVSLKGLIVMQIATMSFVDRDCGDEALAIIRVAGATSGFNYGLSSPWLLHWYRGSQPAKSLSLVVFLLQLTAHNGSGGRGRTMSWTSANSRSGREPPHRSNFAASQGQA